MVSFQAVSGEKRNPAGYSIMQDLADILETTLDNILSKGVRIMKFNRKMSMQMNQRLNALRI